MWRFWEEKRMDGSNCTDYDWNSARLRRQSGRVNAYRQRNGLLLPKLRYTESRHWLPSFSCQLKMERSSRPSPVPFSVSHPIGSERKLNNRQPPPSYHHFIERSIELANGDVDSFWRETLKGSRVTPIVRQTVPSRPMDQYLVQVIPFRFKHPGDINYGVMLKAAWALVLCRFCQSTDVTIWKCRFWQVCRH